MKKIFLIKNRLSGAVMGESDDEEFAKIRAKNFGPNFEVVPSERGADGRVKTPSLASGLAGAAPQRVVHPGSILELGGLVFKAIVEGWTVEQARQAFVGKSKNELWGSMSWLVEEPSQEASFMAEWASATVQAEFGGNLEGFLAYKRMEAKGLVRNCGITRQG